MAKSSLKTMKWSRLAPSAWDKQNWQQEPQEKEKIRKRGMVKFSNPLNFINTWLERYWNSSY